MPGEPTAWAVSESIALAWDLPQPRRAKIARALDAAREEGRRAGIEEAATEALMEHRHLDENGDYSGCVVCNIAADIRALATREPA